MALVCSQCAAPLDVAPGVTLATCNYCGVKVQLGQPKANTPRVVPPKATPAGLSRAARIVLGIGLAYALFAAIGAGLLLRSSDPVPGLPILPVPSLPAALRSVVEPGGPNRFTQPVCELDANGDGVGDLLGMSSSVGVDNQPAVVDGASGKVLWTGASEAKSPQLACLDKRWFALVHSNFQAEFHDVRNLGAPVRVLLRDTLDDFGMGVEAGGSAGEQNKTCVRLKTSDGSVQGVHLPSGTAVSCDAKLKRYRGEGPGIIGLTGQRTELELSKRTYKLSKRRNGTPILTVEVAENGKQVWSRELPYTAPTFNSAIAVAGNSIALWAAAPGDEKHGILVGLDETNGEQRYAVPSTLMVSHSVGYFASNGRYVIVQAWGSLEAYEPDTGKIAWKIGH